MMVNTPAQPNNKQCYKFRSALRGMVRSRTFFNKLVRFWYAKQSKSGLSLNKTTLSSKIDDSD